MVDAGAVTLTDLLLLFLCLEMSPCSACIANRASCLCVSNLYRNRRAGVVHLFGVPGPPNI